MSLITVHLSTNPDFLPVIDVRETWRPWATVKDAVRDMITAFRGLANGLIRVVIYIPVAVVYAGVLWVLYVFARKVWVRLR